MRRASTGKYRSSSFSVTSYQSPRLRLHLLAAQRAARALAGGPSLAPYQVAVDEDVLDAGGRGGRRFESRAIGDRFPIEDRDVGIGSGGKDATSAEAEPGRRQAGHAAHCLFETEKA